MSKKKGLIIYNSFLNGKKYSELVEYLENSCKKYDIEVDSVGNADFYISLSDNKTSDTILNNLDSYDFIVMGDKDIRLGYTLERYLKNTKTRVFNSIDSIKASDDKYETYLRLYDWNLTHSSNEHIPFPKTVILPMTYENIGYTDYDFLDSILKEFSFPFVMKECFGSFGSQVYLVNNKDEVLSTIKKTKSRPVICQEFIENSRGRDVRIQIVGDRVVASMYRNNEKGDFRSNVTNGGTATPYEPCDEEIKLALNAARALGLDFAGVDLMFSGMKNYADIVCEVNSNAHFKVISECNGISVSDYMIEYIMERI
ncbi:MAG: RimK family alpha-L-glutamate ligase [Lachnospiraceae bacterium]|nr:RimK family alpha-L-glutamate ligase [Lachnospiraceae bacterium]